jgi:hypothetical protein
MSFWSGLARGFADADAKKEREAVRGEAEAARKEARDYSRGRDKVMDERYESQQETAAAQAAELKDRFERQFAQTAEQLKLNRGDKLAETEQQQANWQANFERAGEYNKRDWALTLNKWDYTKAQAKEAQENADRIFNLGIEKFEYGKTRDVVGDLRADRVEARAIAAELYSKERDLVNDDQALKNYNLRMRQFEEQVKNAGITQEQWQQSFDLKKEEVEVGRSSKLLALMPSSHVTALGGGPTNAGGNKGSSNVISAQAMQEGSLTFQAEFKNLDEATQKSEFFKAAASSLGAQATLMAFRDAQAKKGNPIELEDLPKYFKYLGAVEGKGEAEAKEFMDSLLSGDANLGDKDTFIGGLMVMRNYKPTQQLFRQVDTPGTIDDASKQLPVWENAVEVDAYRALPKLEGDDKGMVKRALALLETKANRTQGLDILAKFGYGANAVEEYNMGDNPVIRSYYGDSVPTRQSTAVAPQEATVTSTEPEGATTFANWDEVTKARQKGFSGVAVVGGTPYSIAPQGAPAGEAPVAEEPTEDFLGTGRIEPKVDTAIDAMFYDASGLADSAVEGEPMKYTRPEQTPDVDLEKGVENISDIPDTFESPEEIEKGVNLALEEIEELGIVFPTTNTELVEFRDDLKELVYEMGADIPEPVLIEVIKRATENAKGGLSAAGTLMDANETGLGQGGDPTDTPVGTQLKEDLPANLEEFKAFTDSLAITEPDTKKRKPEPEPKLNRSEISRLQRAVESGNTELVEKLVKKYGEEKIEETLKEMGL